MHRTLLLQPHGRGVFAPCEEMRVKKWCGTPREHSGEQPTTKSGEFTGQMNPLALKFGFSTPPRCILNPKIRTRTPLAWVILHPCPGFHSASVGLPLSLGCKPISQSAHASRVRHLLEKISYKSLYCASQFTSYMVIFFFAMTVMPLNN